MAEKSRESGSQVVMGHLPKDHHSPHFYPVFWSWSAGCQCLLPRQLFGLEEQAVDWMGAACWAGSHHSDSIQDDGTLLTNFHLFSGA